MLYVLKNEQTVRALKYSTPMSQPLIKLLKEHKEQAMWTPHGQLRLRINGNPTTVPEGFYVVESPDGLLTMRDPILFKHQYINKKSNRETALIKELKKRSKSINKRINKLLKNPEYASVNELASIIRSIDELEQYRNDTKKRRKK